MMRILSFVSTLVPLLAFCLSSSGVGTHAIDVGEMIPPDLSFHFGFPPEDVSLDARLRNKRVVLVGLPGAFTPT